MTRSNCIETIFSEQIDDGNEPTKSIINTDTSKTHTIKLNAHNLPRNLHRIISEAKAVVRIDSHDGKNDTKQESETVQYSAAANGKRSINDYLRY